MVVAAFEIRLVGILAGRQLTNALAHALLGTIEQLGDAGLERRVAVSRHKRLHTLGGLSAGADHGPEIALTLARATHVGEDEIERRLVGAAALDDADRRNAHAFLVDLGRAPGETARAHPSDVPP